MSPIHMSTVYYLCFTITSSTSFLETIIIDVQEERGKKLKSVTLVKSTGKTYVRDYIKSIFRG